MPVIVTMIKFKGSLPLGQLFVVLLALLPSVVTGTSVVDVCRCA